MTFRVRWHDSGREPRSKPNPAYPCGIDADLSDGAAATCSLKLDYPARRCGAYTICCEDCGLFVVVTTAGRPDDPRSVKLGCRLSGDKKAN
jgi:hypothetical protein